VNGEITGKYEAKSSRRISKPSARVMWMVVSADAAEADTVEVDSTVARTGAATGTVVMGIEDNAAEVVKVKCNLRLNHRPIRLLCSRSRSDVRGGILTVCL
jgi:hypothetical protein